jgi:CheY-like chemotaxis protein
LAAGVAHDFNNLLTGITGFTRFAHDAQPVGSESRKDLAEVLTLGARAATLIRQLMAFSRKQTLQPVVLNINDLIGNLENMLKRVLGEHLDLEWRLAEELGDVKADPGQIEQVLVNLAVNARDAMPGGGKLTIETANVELDAEYAAAHVGTLAGSYIMLAVTDNGCGIEPSVLAHMFEPFFTTKAIGKGTGLGLATAYGIAKQHGGNVWAYSEVGRGTTFKVYLPRVSETLEEQGDIETNDLPQGSETILIVEDEDAVRQVAARILEQRGYKVLTAALPSLADEILAAQGEQIALLLTDVVMPERDGQKLFESAHTTHPNLRVLYMSGYTDRSVAHQGGLEKGAPFIQKPFTAAALLDKVREVLARTSGEKGIHGGPDAGRS